METPQIITMRTAKIHKFLKNDLFYGVGFGNFSYRIILDTLGRVQRKSKNQQQKYIKYRYMIGSIGRVQNLFLIIIALTNLSKIIFK